MPKLSSVVSSQTRALPRCVADDPAIISALHPPNTSMCDQFDTALKTSEIQYQSSIETTEASSRAYKITSTWSDIPSDEGILNSPEFFPTMNCRLFLVISLLFSHQIVPPFSFIPWVPLIIGVQEMSDWLDDIAQAF